MEGTHDQHEHLNHDPEPRIYAASLADYNNGNLHGRWIDANQDPDDLHVAIADMLSTSKIPGAEEWAIHDYEGFGSFRLSEYESIETVARIARGIADHGTVFAHWVDHVGTTDTDSLDHFDEHYLGTWDSLSDYAEQLLDDLGVDLDHLVPGWLSPYVTIDYEQLGHDMAADLYVSEDGSETHVFEPRG